MRRAAPDGPGTISRRPAETPTVVLPASLSARKRQAAFRLAVGSVAQLAFLAGILILSACYTPAAKLTSFDVLALPGEKVVLQAKVERDGPGLINPDLKGAEVEFLRSPIPTISEGEASAPPPLAPDPTAALLEGSTVVGSVATGENGMARLEVAAPDRAGDHLFWVRLKRPGELSLREPLAVFLVSVIPPGSAIAISDIDNTIATTRIGAVLNDEAERIDPLPGSPELLTELARNHRIIYLTARSTYLTHRTRRWLSLHRYPSGPVIFRDVWGEWRGLTWKEGEFKRRFIQDSIKKRWPDVRWGFGNTQGDVEAYAGNGIRTVIIDGKPSWITEANRKLVKLVADWAEARKAILP